jgi:Rrf2 family protein
MRYFDTTLEYALLAAQDLAEHYDRDDPVKASDIARRTSIPSSYLAQILLQLKRAALVKTKRGPSGGYWLMRRPDLITLDEIVLAVEGEGRERPEPHEGGRRAVLALERYLEDGRNRMLSEITLSSFVEEAQNLEENPPQTPDAGQS